MEYGYSAIESFVEFCDDMMIAEEGYNMEIWGKFKSSNKRMKSLKKEAKSLMKTGRYKEAVNKLNSIKSEIGVVKKLVKSHPDQDSISSAVFGHFTHSVLYISNMLLGFIPIVGFPVAMIKQLKDSVYFIIEFIRGLKDEEVNVRSFNSFRIAILSKLTDLEKITDKMIRECKASASNRN